MSNGRRFDNTINDVACEDWTLIKEENKLQTVLNVAPNNPKPPERHTNSNPAEWSK